MKLSEALELASISGNVKRENNWRNCALGEAANMVGIPMPLGCNFLGELITFHERPATITARWPWLNEEYPHIADMTFGQVFSDLFELGCESVIGLANLARRFEPECGECNQFDCTCVKEEECLTTSQTPSLIGL